VAGSDRASFLQGLLTNDIQALTGGGLLRGLAHAAGRMLTDMHVLESDGMILLDVPAAQAEATRPAGAVPLLRGREAGSLAGALATVWVHGPGGRGARAVARRRSGLGEWPQYRHAHVALPESRWSSRASISWRAGLLRVSQRRPPRRSRRALGQGRAPWARGAGGGRIEAAYPLFGIDMTADTIPSKRHRAARDLHLERLLRRAGSHHPRLHRGHGRVARKLVTVKLEAAAPKRERSCRRRPRVGFVTSAAVSPRSGPSPSAYVHRDCADATVASRRLGPVRGVGVEPLP
jgi:glycine cleavage system aminomethyltransferase T